MLKASLRRLYTSPTVRVVSSLASSNLLGVAITAVGTLVQAQFVSPADLGYFRGFSIATGYVFIFQVGILHALERFYPYYIGKGENERALAVAEICQAWSVGVSALLSGAFVLLATISLVQGNGYAMLAWLVQAIIIATAIYGGYMNATYRSGHDFLTVARSSILSSGITLLTLPLFPFWPFVAMAFRSGLGGFTGLIYLHLRRPLHLPWRFNVREWLALVREGVPIFIASYGVGMGWIAVETSIVLKNLGTQALGLWSMSYMLADAARQVPQALTAVYIPRLTGHFGQTESARQCLRLCRKPVLVGVAGSLVLVAAAWVVIPFAVTLLMPKYTDAIPSMRLMMWMLPLAALDLPYSLLVAMGKTGRQNICSYAGLGSFVVLALLAVQFDLGLNGVIVASLLGKAVRSACIYAFVFWACRHGEDVSPAGVEQVGSIVLPPNILPEA